MSQMKEQPNINNPFARNLGQQVKKAPQQAPKADPARDNVKKQIIDAFDVQGEINENSKFTNEELATEIENSIFEVSGKNSKDKAYREKAKRILSRLKGNRNNTARSLVKTSVITVSEFCKLSEKQLEDDSYFEKFNNSNIKSSNPVDSKPKIGVRPPILKNIPVHSIDLSNNVNEINDYFNNNSGQASSTKQIEETIQNSTQNLNDNEGNINAINNVNNYAFNNYESMNMNDDNASNKVFTEIDTNSVKTGTFSVLEDNREVSAETGRNSPRMNNGLSISYNPPTRNKIINSNQAVETIGNKNLNLNLSNNQFMSNTVVEEIVIEKNPPQSRKDNLEKLKELMEKKKMAKSLNMPVNRSAGIKNVINTNNNINQIENSTAPEKQQIQTESNLFDYAKAEEPTDLNNPELMYGTTGNNLAVNKNLQIVETKQTIQISNDIANESKFIQFSENLEISEHSEHIKNLQDDSNNYLIPSSNQYNNIQSTNNQINGKSDSNFPSIETITSINTQKNQITDLQNKNIFEEQVIETTVFKQEVIKETIEINEIPVNTFVEKVVTKIEASQPLSVDDRVEYNREISTQNIRNSMNISADSFNSIKDKICDFYGIKISLESQIELANKKFEIYQKEMDQLRKTVNDLKLQLSKTNEESYKLEISRLKHNLAKNDQDRENLTRENNLLKQQLKKYEDNMESMIEDNKRFRNEAERKFFQYNSDIENLLVKQNNNINSVASITNDNIIEKKDDYQEKEEPIFNVNDKYIENNNFNHQNANSYKREIKIKNNSTQNSIHSQNNINNLTSNHKANDNSNSCRPYKSNIIEIDQDLNEAMLISHENDTNNYDRNAFTNGNPNIIEEVGADNYLNMNGNTYDEMKDMKQDDDHLQDHQYYENIHNNLNTNYDPINMEFTHFNKKANTGDTFNNNNSIFNQQNDNKAGESGASETNYIFGQEDEDKFGESNIFDVMTKNVNQNKLSTKEKQIKNSANRGNFNNEKEEKNNSFKINPNNIQSSQNIKKLNNQTKVNTIPRTKLPSNNKKNVFDENDAFDIFDKSDNAENIFDTFSKKTNKNNPDNLFD